jgi:organic radical activating enzyme
MLNEVFYKTKDKLNDVGCGFCLAKWTQVTMHLHNGMTHSCHHPAPHKIPLEEIKENPTALHNTEFKKEQRQKMLNGKRPSECKYCWSIEDNSNGFSDRIYKSSEPWSAPHFDDILKIGWKENYNPKYVEVSFSNICNFKCSYCSPMFSSKWMEEINKYGPYRTSEKFNNLDYIKDMNMMPYHHEEYNPYVDAFWKWWPDLYKDLDTFRITGGEPLLTKDTFKILDYIIDAKEPNKNIKICINSNLGVSQDIFDKFVDRMEKILDKELVYEFVIFASADTWGKQAEYIRHGLDFNLFWERIDFLLDKFHNITIDVMSTYNVLSVPSYKELIDNIYILKKRYHNSYRFWGSALFLDSSYLRWPEHQTVKILDDEWYNEIDEQAKLVDFYEQTRIGLYDGYGFTDMEINKIKRIRDWYISGEGNEELKTNRRDFYKFIREHDKRRGTDFVKTFPELEDFLQKCRVSR